MEIGATALLVVVVGAMLAFGGTNVFRRNPGSKSSKKDKGES